MINDFIELIKYLIGKRKKNIKINDINITEETKIYEVVKNLEDTFSNNFIKIFENNGHLTIDKTPEIFLYYLKLNFELIKGELSNYQNELNNKSKEEINNYYQKEHLISRKDFACAIRLFSTLVLFLEEDKKHKIKYNRNNLVKYLKASDLWIDIYDNKNSNKNLYELRSFKDQVNQIICLYEYLGGDIEQNFVKDVIEQIKKENKPTNLLEEKVDDGNDNEENMFGKDEDHIDEEDESSDEEDEDDKEDQNDEEGDFD